MIPAPPPIGVGLVRSAPVPRPSSRPDDGRRFAYADPPYIGQAKRHYGDHPDYAGEVDHGDLIERLERDYDGWALSLSMKSLPHIMKLCPDDVLTLAWVKPWSTPMGDHRRYSWEPVILRACRRPGPGYLHTHLILSPPGYSWRPEPESHVIGEKPEGFAWWIFDSAGLTPHDEMHDLFPGSGAIGRAWETWRVRPPSLPLHEPDYTQEALAL